MNRMLTIVAIAAAIAGCKKKDESAPASGSAAPASAAPASGTGTASAAPAAPAAPAAGGKVDVALPASVKFADPAKVQVAGKTVTSEPCKLDKRAPDMKSDDFSGAILDMVVGPDGAIYVIDDQHKVRKYLVQSASPCELALDQKWGQNGLVAITPSSKDSGVSRLAIDDKGNVYASGDKIHRLGADGKDTVICPDEDGYLVIDPSNGAAYLGSDNKVTITGDQCNKTPLPTDWDKMPKDTSVSVVDASGGQLFVSANIDSTNKLGVYKDDKQLALVGDKDGDNELCTVATATACSAGYCVADANCRKLVIWGTDGKPVVSTDLNALLGVSYSWPTRMVMGKDAAWIIYGQSGEDKDSQTTYGLISRITGL